MPGYSLQHKLFVLCHCGVWFTSCQFAKSSFFLYPEDVWRCLYHLLEYLNQEIRRKREVAISAAFLSCSLQVVAHSIFFPHLYWWLSIIFQMAFPEQNPHQRTIPIFQSVPFPPTILPQQFDAGAIKNEGCVS